MTDPKKIEELSEKVKTLEEQIAFIMKHLNLKMPKKQSVPIDPRDAFRIFEMKKE
ncbi:MAG: hypothetical protein HZB62_15125 [Nitrospirae bacterium]|nr:hypothetical protein [Nitrospirota bacterium]